MLGSGNICTNKPCEPLAQEPLLPTSSLIWPAWNSCCLRFCSCLSDARCTSVSGCSDGHLAATVTSSPPPPPPPHFIWKLQVFIVHYFSFWLYSSPQFVPRHSCLKQLVSSQVSPSCIHEFLKRVCGWLTEGFLCSLEIPAFGFFPGG